ADSITNAFAAARKHDVRTQYFLHRRMIIKINDGEFWRREPAAIPEDAKVVAEADTFSGIGAQVPYAPDGKITPITWGQLRAILHQAGGGPVPWMDQVNDAIVMEAGRSRATSTPISFRTRDGNVLRATLVRHKLYNSGARKFYLL